MHPLLSETRPVVFVAVPHAHESRIVKRRLRVHSTSLAVDLLGKVSELWGC
jgi:hypothetical protein